MCNIWFSQTALLPYVAYLHAPVRLIYFRYVLMFMSCKFLMSLRIFILAVALHFGNHLLLKLHRYEVTQHIVRSKHFLSNKKCLETLYFMKCLVPRCNYQPGILVSIFFSLTISHLFIFLIFLR